MANVAPVLRWIVAVLASAWFMPVSCVTAMSVGAGILVENDARDAARGESVHRSIAVVALPPPAPGQTFGYLLLGNLSSYKERHPEASFLMPGTEGQIDIGGHTVVAYKVVATGSAEQTIETQYRDGDREAWGRYRASRREITPLASKLSLSDYLHEALGYAFGFALLVFAGARLLRRRIGPHVQAA